MLWLHPRDAKTQKQCPHPKPLPRWERVEDVGFEERATRFYCSTCDSFLPATPTRTPARQR